MGEVVEVEKVERVEEVGEVLGLFAVPSFMQLVFDDKNRQRHQGDEHRQYGTNVVMEVFGYPCNDQ